MKAYQISNYYDFGSMVVFAETAGKAKAYALSFDEFDDCEFTELRAIRNKEADKLYKESKSYLDWENPQDRLFLVKECNWQCGYPEYEDCKNCIANRYCNVYEVEE